MTPQQKQNLINKFRNAVSNIINGVDQFNSAKTEYDALDAGNQIDDSDFKGTDNQGLSKDDLVNAIAAIDGLLKGLQGGVKTVVYKVKL